MADPSVSQPITPSLPGVDSTSPLPAVSDVGDAADLSAHSAPLSIIFNIEQAEGLYPVDVKEELPPSKENNGSSRIRSKYFDSNSSAYIPSLARLLQTQAAAAEAAAQLLEAGTAGKKGIKTVPTSNGGAGKKGAAEEEKAVVNLGTLHTLVSFNTFAHHSHHSQQPHSPSQHILFTPPSTDHNYQYTHRETLPPSTLFLDSIHSKKHTLHLYQFFPLAVELADNAAQDKKGGKKQPAATAATKKDDTSSSTHPASSATSYPADALTLIGTIDLSFDAFFRWREQD